MIRYCTFINLSLQISPNKTKKHRRKMILFFILLYEYKKKIYILLLRFPLNGNTT